MNVLLITDGIYPFVTGGMQKHSYYLAKFLSKVGVNLCLVHCTTEYQGIDEKNNIEFKDFNHSKITFKKYDFPSFKFIGHYIRENKHYSNTIFNDLKNQLNNYDLIYCQGFTGWRFIKESKKGKLHIPIVSNLHGYNMFQKAPSLKAKLGYYLVQGTAKNISLNSDFVFSFGGIVSETLKGLGLNEEQIIESPIGIESSWLIDNVKEEVNTVRKFIFIGRNERLKGIQELSIALKQLIKENNQNFEFHFVGEIDKKHRIDSKSIIYHGKVIGDEKIQKILQSCDVLIIPSYSEGMPTVILEAMASGLAIIGTNVGAIDQQVNYNNGWIIPNSKIQTIKSAIENAININNDELIRLKKNSLNKVKNNFLWEQVINHKVKCFKHIIDKYKKQSKTN